jgi:4-hydroxythreonine-4-phosphate dehydrogenase
MTAAAKASDKPVIALAMGDPAGISAELTARLLVEPEVLAAAQYVVIGDRRMLEAGARVAGVRPSYEVAGVDAVLPKEDLRQPLLIDLATLDPATVRLGEATAAGGRFALENLRTALALGVRGVVDAVTFTPFNKTAMRLAEGSYEDEIVFGVAALGLKVKAGEFNIIEGLWNARVTSHVPLSGVAPLITRESVGQAIRLTDQAMRAAGFKPPRIAVAALNPHAGDGGNFGREEIDVIGPAVAAAKAEGLHCDGPYPSDTVFVRARRGQFDGVVTMYHDQGQIAMKLLGFESGVTLLGGFPFPFCTPAHGTAYDIAGKGVANVGASKEAMLLAARMGRAARAASRPTGAAASIREHRRAITA